MNDHQKDIVAVKVQHLKTNLDALIEERDRTYERLVKQALIDQRAYLEVLEDGLGDHEAPAEGSVRRVV